MKNIYIVHCWEGTKEDGWYPWIDTNLSDEGNTVYRFNMPNTDNPKIEEWVPFLDKQVKELNQDTYFIGHSIGCQTILRYLEKKDITKIGGIILVAPWLELLPEAVSDEESFETAKPWLTTPIDFEKVKKFTNNITCIFSDDDYFVPMTEKEKFEKLLDAKTIVLHNKGHISADDEVYELPEVIELMSNK